MTYRTYQKGLHSWEGGGGGGATPDLSHVHTSQNFCLFCKKLRQQKPVSSANDVFHRPKLLMSCHQTSKMPSRIFGGLQSFVRRLNPLFLASYPSSGHLISRT